MPETFDDDPTASSTGSINTPELSSNLKPQRRAISGVKQARQIITNLEQAARERNQKNARIMAKYNSEKPWRQEELENEGLGWKSNFTTKPLPMLIDKVAPRFRRAVENVKYLTNSALPDDVPGNAVKTETFQREITKLIRSRPAWGELISEISQENALFGFTTVAWLDEFHWFPKHFRQDQFFVPTGTKQDPGSAQVVVLRERFLVHELFALIEDKEAAKLAGWNVPATVEVINKAIPENRRSKQSDWERVYEDLFREANVGLSHEAGPLVVDVWHLIAQEVTGKVSHYIFQELNSDSGSETFSTEDRETLFEREDQFDSMKDSLAFFSFQQGNGNLHGSKGIGREIYAMAAMLDRARNEVVDRLNLSGKIIIQGDEKALRRFKMSVVGNALLIGQAYQVSTRKLEAEVEPFLQLDQFLTSLLDQMAGAVTPKALEGERVTAAAVNLLAGREEESRDNILSRFLTQFASMVSTMQIRICDPSTDDEDAKEFQKKMLEIMERKELNQLCEMPASETVADYTEQERQSIILIAQEGRGNPLYNQKELERRKLTAQIDDAFADAVLLPDNDPTEAAEQTRLQQLELMLIAGQGAEVPISPRDNHMVHLQVLLPAMEQAAQVAAEQPDALPVLQAMHLHATGHLEAAAASGVPKEEIAQIADILNQLGAAMAELQQLSEAQANAEQLANQAIQEESIPPEQLPPPI